MQAECCYSFDATTGLSMRRVEPGYEPQPGELVSGADLASDADLEARWPGCTTFVLPPTSCTRLGLKRAFDERGLWPKVRAMIASNDAMQEEWDLATELKVTDPIVQKAIGGLALLGTALTPAEVGQLMIRANALVA